MEREDGSGAGPNGGSGDATDTGGDGTPIWAALGGVDPTDPWSASDVDVRAAMRACLAADAPAAVATVAAVEGSAYRRPGARMIVDEEGHHLGGITAGCLEEPVVDLAGAVIETGEPTTETFDLTEGGEWDFGLGCNGVITVVVEPLDASWEPVLVTLERGERVGVATALDASDHAFADAEGAFERGARVVRTAGGATPPGADPESWPDRRPLPPGVRSAIDDELSQAIADGITRVATVDHDGSTVRVLLEGLAPPDRLLVFGAQPDVRPLSRLARRVGFHVTVASPRGARADDADFPAAHEVRASRPDALGDLVDARTYAVCMSHSFAEDQLALATLVDTEAPYVGVMGPPDRFEQLREALAEDGVDLGGEALERIAAPVGLDLGADAPPEIATSIVAEVLAVANGRSGGRLRDVDAPIHGRPNGG